jgi:DNA-binding response OmpR family regulator
MVTSKSMDSDRYWGLKRGADDYVTKPFDDDELLANVARLL